MKKVLVITILTVLTLSDSFGQVSIIKKVDEMTDKTSYYPSEKLIAANKDLTKGCSIDMVIDIKGEVKSSSFFVVQMVGLKSCNEDNVLIILFENGDKINTKSWSKFNCKGDAFFQFSKSNIELLKINPISKIRITNGKSYESYTADIEYKNYFIELYHAL